MEGLSWRVGMQDLSSCRRHGLDTRPFRLELQPSLRWFEIDLPVVFDRSASSGMPAGRRPKPVNQARAGPIPLGWPIPARSRVILNRRT